MVLREEYETYHGIYDHDNSAVYRPLAMVAMHPKEDASNYSQLYRAIWRYHLTKMYEITHMHVMDFLKMPREYCTLMYRIAESIAEQSTNEIDEVTRRLQNEQRLAQTQNR